MTIETNEQQEQGIESVDVDALNGGEFDFEEFETSVVKSNENMPYGDVSFDVASTTIYADDFIIKHEETYDMIFNKMVPGKDYFHLQDAELGDILIVKVPGEENSYTAKGFKSIENGMVDFTNFYDNPSGIINRFNGVSSIERSKVVGSE